MALDQVLSNVVQGLINVTAGTEVNTSIPPAQNGEFRIPFIKNLRLGPVSSYFGGTQFTLLWDEPDTTESISHYNVYVVGALGSNQAPIFANSATVSPAYFRVTPSETGIVTFFVQTQLANGNVSDISRSPTITARAQPPQIHTGDVATGTVLPAFGYTVERTTTNIAIAAATNLVWVDATLGAIVVNLTETPFEGQQVIIKKLDTTANTVTISTPALGTFMEAGAIIPGGSAGALTLVFQSQAVPGGGGLGDRTWRIISRL